MNRYLDFERLDTIDPRGFKQTRPYPFCNPGGVLFEDGYRRLLADMPDIGLFHRNFGKARRAGQAPHDRYSLEYQPGLAVPTPWLEFIDELLGGRYRRAMARLLGRHERTPVRLRLHWHYTPSGCGVSPHTDSPRELGSHLFYFNSAADWNPAWGGETLVLDDGGRLHFDSAPGFADFVREIPVHSLDNHSAILKRTDHAWHAVRAIQCPADRLRRVFIVVVSPGGLRWRLRDRIVGKRVRRL